MSFPKTVGIGGFGKIRVYYSKKYKRKVIEKRVGPNFIRTKESNRARLTTLIKNYSQNEIVLKKEMFFMMLTKVGQLDCCVEILGFLDNPFRIIMEYCEGGDLRKILNKYEVPILDKVTMISQILTAIADIHEFGLIHGDLKCENIFLVNKYTPGDTKNIRIKIGDFGLSEIGGNLVYGGTPGFMAPEVPEFGGSFEADIYSIGKVMLEIMTQLPVQMIAIINIESLYTIKNKLPKFLNATEFYNVVIPCLCENPKKRPDAEELFTNFHSLMKYWINCEKINDTILEKYKIGEKFHVDCHKHPLILSNDLMRQYQGGKWFCDICKNTDKSFLDNTLSFHCHSCKYDLCQKCIEEHNYININNKMSQHVQKGKKAYVSQHPYYLLLTSKEGRNYWNCDICKVEASSYVSSFRCENCDYDVCLCCYEKFFVIREEPCCCIIY